MSARNTYRRVDLAIEQLDVALDLFLQARSYVATLTLAGAAEEVLGQALSLAGKESSLQYKYEAMARFERQLRRRPLESKAFVDGENDARNAAKHMRAGDEASITADLQEAALWMLVRACANYDRLDFQRTDRMREFDNWFYEHAVGV